MRKLLIILLFLTAVLGFGTEDAASRAPHASTTCVNPAGGSGDCMTPIATDEWRCQREYNYDLDLPRTMGQVAPRPATPAFSFAAGTGAASAAAYAAARQAAARHSATLRYGANMRMARNPKLTLGSPTLYLSSAHDAVDYYVYCLRQLII